MLSVHCPVSGKSTQWAGKAKERCCSPSSVLPEHQLLLMIEEHKHCSKGRPIALGCPPPIWQLLKLARPRWAATTNTGLKEKARAGRRQPKCSWQCVPCLCVTLIFCSLLNSRASAREIFYVNLRAFLHIYLLQQAREKEIYSEVLR